MSDKPKPDKGALVATYVVLGAISVLFSVRLVSVLKPEPPPPTLTEAQRKENEEFQERLLRGLKRTAELQQQCEEVFGADAHKVCAHLQRD